MSAEQSYFDATHLGHLLRGLPLGLPDDLPHRRGSTDEELVGLLNTEARRLNPFYGSPQPEELKVPFSEVPEGGDDGPDAIPKSELYVRSRSILRTGKTAILLESIAEYFDIASDGDPQGSEWRYRETDKMLLSVPVPRLDKDASLALFFTARSLRERTTSTEATYKIGSAWELRIPVLPELHAFGIRDEEVTTHASRTIAQQYFSNTFGIIEDLPATRTIPGTGLVGHVDGKSLGLIKGGQFDNGACREVVGVGAAILQAADKSEFKPLDPSD